jgi:hypothetical protein
MPPKTFLPTLALALLPAAPGRAADQPGRVQKARQAVRVACAGDIGLNCKDLDFDTGLVKCLDKSRDILADECRNALRKNRPLLQRRRLRPARPPAAAAAG